MDESCKTDEFSLSQYSFELKLIYVDSFTSFSNQPIRNTLKLFYHDKIVTHATQSLVW